MDTLKGTYYERLASWLVNHVLYFDCIDRFLREHTRYRMRGSGDFFYWPIVGRDWWKYKYCKSMGHLDEKNNHK